MLSTTAFGGAASEAALRPSYRVGSELASSLEAFAEAGDCEFAHDVVLLSEPPTDLEPELATVEVGWGLLSVTAFGAAAAASRSSLRADSELANSLEVRVALV